MSNDFKPIFSEVCFYEARPTKGAHLKPVSILIPCTNFGMRGTLLVVGHLCPQWRLASIEHWTYTSVVQNPLVEILFKASVKDKLIDPDTMYLDVTEWKQINDFVNRYPDYRHEWVDNQRVKDLAKRDAKAFLERKREELNFALSADPLDDFDRKLSPKLKKLFKSKNFGKIVTDRGDRYLKRKLK